MDIGFVVSGLNMSKKELAKWGKKVKLYVALHPNFEWNQFCGPEGKICPYYSHDCGTRRIFINEKTWKTMIGDDYPRNDWWCCEWVKYV